MKIFKIIVPLVICAIFLALTIWFIKYFSRADISEFHIKVSAKEFSLDLKTRENNIKQAIAQEQDPQKKAVKQKELDVAQKQIENPEKALKEYEEKAAAAYKALEGLKEEFGKRSLAQAKEALEKGDPSLADKLFQEVLAKGNPAQQAEAAYQLGSLAESRIDYGQANKYYQQAVNLQSYNPLYLNAAGNLSRTLGNYQESEKFLKRALELREKSLSPEHPDVAQSLNNLAGLYMEQGKYGEAETLFQRALAIREKVLGPENPDVAQSLNNLASLYHDQGKYGEAEPLYKRALAIDEKALGPEHPDVAGRLNNLASLYREQGRYNEAEPLCKRALAIFEKALGPEHPNVATCLKNYAALLKKMGRGAEAAPLEARAQAIRAKQAQDNPPK